MIKWKKHLFGAIANNVESLTDILGGMSGKNRRVIAVAATIDSDIYIRIYRDADQIVDFPCDLLTTQAPILTLDIPLAEGQLLKVGFGNVAAGSVTPTISIGYEETG